MPLKALHFRQFICIKNPQNEDFLIKVVGGFLAKYKMQLYKN
jgi:hypothetical protein